jgi:hypothetical protein
LGPRPNFEWADSEADRRHQVSRASRRLRHARRDCSLAAQSPKNIYRGRILGQGSNVFQSSGGEFTPETCHGESDETDLDQV